MSDPWPTPLRFLPGNHDVSDSPPVLGNPAQHPLNSKLLECFHATFGPDSWTIAKAGWLVMLFGTNHASEIEQWRWFDERVQEAGTRAVALMLHKPVFQKSRLDVAPHIRYVPLAPRRRLLNLIARLDLRIVLSGHTHHSRRGSAFD